MSKEDIKYVATVPQIAEIVAYCLSMTIHGDSGKDWTKNVETAIEGINGVGYGRPKVKLQRLDVSMANGLRDVFIPVKNTKSNIKIHKVR